MDEPVRAAGAVLWRDGEYGLQVALVHRPRYDDWSFPKGKLDKGEHVLRAAVREVTEETGIVPRLGRRLPTSTYLKGGRAKRVDYWAARAAAAAVPEFVPNDEVDRLEWLSHEDAERRLTHSGDVDLLHAFAAGPLRTRPLVILRHADAGEKRAWREPDELRPLDAGGRADAAALAPVLRAFGPARPMASATARCVETVLPYVRLTGADVVTERAFTVGESGPDQACRRLFELLQDEAPLLVCTHGEIVADLVTGLCRRFGEKPPEEPALDKGAFWVAHLAGDAIASLERHNARS
ncbi:NUDIX hydrolase [Actinomadura macrotermitis]|uniref:Putative 8-oxo-dGTP diphosphatase 1 n=1 Tax=Actinomadura macrotermitis TaxID=2585200 RepID=A0A7K0BUK9_9ACTN|nr:NUDIX hydrolase [Actinomadura macrotermitis]MQY04878.1 putative 8-oxo-dGTP diphosphatase 1 [Actinomadura macrotermitis]